MKCIICNSTIKEKHVIKENKLYFKCSLCGLVQQNLLNINTKKYSDFSYEVGFSREYYIRKRAQNILYELLNINRNIDSVIDIGSGAGFMLDEFRKKIGVVIGVEPSKKLANYATRNYDLKIVNEYFSSTTIKKLDRKFDVVILSHIIEHLDNPINFFMMLKSILAKNGIIYVETPNVLGWLALVEGRNYTFLTPEDHICLYSKKSFDRFIKNSNINLKSIYSYTYSDSEHIIGILSKLKRYTFLKKTTNKQQSTLRNSNLSKKILSFQNDALHKLLKPVFMPLINFGAKGSYLVYYLKSAG